MRFSNPYVSLLEDFNSKLLAEIPECGRTTASEKLSELSRQVIPAEGVVGFIGAKDSITLDFTSDVRQLVVVPYMGSTTEASRRLATAFVRLTRDRRRQFADWLIKPVQHFALLVNEQDELDCSSELAVQLTEAQHLRDRVWSTNGGELKQYLKLTSRIVESEEYRELFGEEQLSRARIATDKLTLSLPPERNVVLKQYAPTNPLEDVSADLFSKLSGIYAPTSNSVTAHAVIHRFFKSLIGVSVVELKPSAASECAEQVLAFGNVDPRSKQAREVCAAAVRFERRLESLQKEINGYSALAAKHFNELKHVLKPGSDLVAINVLNKIEDSATRVKNPEGLQGYLNEVERMLRIGRLERCLEDTSSNRKLVQLTARLEATAMLDVLL